MLSRFLSVLAHAGLSGLDTRRSFASPVLGIAIAIGIGSAAQADTVIATFNGTYTTTTLQTWVGGLITGETRPTSILINNSFSVQFDTTQIQTSLGFSDTGAATYTTDPYREGVAPNGSAPFGVLSQATGGVSDAASSSGDPGLSAETAVVDSLDEYSAETFANLQGQFVNQLTGNMLADLETALSQKWAFNFTNSVGIPDQGYDSVDSGTATITSIVDNGTLLTPPGLNTVNLPGGSISSPVPVTTASLTEIDSAIGGATTSDFYSFNWGGGEFSSTAVLTGAAFGTTYDLELLNYGFSPTETPLPDPLVAELDGIDYFTAGLSPVLGAGTYEIGITTASNVDPNFALDFNTPINIPATTEAPAPASLALLGFGLLAIGGLRQKANAA